MKLIDLFEASKLQSNTPVDRESPHIQVVVDGRLAYEGTGEVENTEDPDSEIEYLVGGALFVQVPYPENDWPHKF